MKLKNLKSNLKAISYLLVLIAVISFSSGCKKSKVDQTPPKLAFQTGIYMGSLDNKNTNQHFDRFKIEVTKMDTTTYQIKEVDNGGLSTFIMKYKGEGPGAVIYFVIPSQNVDGMLYSGNGIPDTFDVIFYINPNDYHLVFDLSIGSDRNKFINFNGSRQ